MKDHHPDQVISSANEKWENKSKTSARGGLISRNVTVNNHRTSIRLESEMWSGFREICRRERASMHELCTMVAEHKPPGTSLTAAIRVFIMAYFRAASTEDGHMKAGHGPGGFFMASQKIQVIPANTCRTLGTGEGENMIFR